jgi:hypothetical protein
MRARGRLVAVLLGLAGVAVAVAAYVGTRPLSGVPTDAPGTEREDADRGAPPPPALAARSPARSPRGDDVPAERPAHEGRDAGAGSGVAGRVVDVEGRPVRGARVLSSTGHELATTDDEGKFQVERPEGQGLRIAAPGLPEVPVSFEAVREGMQIALPKTWEISGTVHDARTEAPVVGIAVTARPATSAYAAHAIVATWRPDGRFSLVVPEAGTYALDVGTRYLGTPATPSDEWIPARVEGVAAGTTDVRVALVRGLAIEGKIVDDAGEPVLRSVTVDAVGRTAAGDPDYTVRKISRVGSGNLLVPGLMPGRYDLWIRPDADSLVDVNGAQVSATVIRDVAAGTSGLVVRLARGFVLAGRLDDGAGGRVLGAGTVYAYREGEMGRSHGVVGEVPGDGTFRIAPLDGAYRYDVLATGFSGRRQGTTTGVSPRDGEVVVVLPSAGRIAGRIRTSDGKPVPAGVPVGVFGEVSDPGAPGARGFGYSSADGAFAVEGLAEMPFTVEAGGGRSGYLGTAVSGVKPGTTDLVLEVSVGVDLSGTLVDDRGEPVATTSLQADDGARTAAMRPFAQVGSDGKFLFRGLRAGRVRLSMMADRRWVALGEVDAPGKNLRVTVPAR